MQLSGSGLDILFLNSGFWLADETAFVERGAAHGRVIAPVHQGFGDRDASNTVTSVDDLAYLYLALIDTMKLDNVSLVGQAFGAWIAAAMAVKTDPKLSPLAL